MRTVLLGVLLGFPVLALAQEGAVRENLPDWKYQLKLPPLDKGPEKGPDLLAVELTPAVFGAAREDLGDLRLVDGNGNSIPYALRELRERWMRDEIKARPFGKQTLPDGSEQLSLDLGANPPEHNEIALDVADPAYSRRLLLEGSDDGQNWGTLLEKAEVIRLATRGQSINASRFIYPPSRQRYLRVKLERDLYEKAPNSLRAATVFFTVEQPGRLVERTANIEYRDPVRDETMAPASAWVFDLQENNVPVMRLKLPFSQQQFQRPYRLEILGLSGERQSVSSGTIARRSGTEPVILDFPEVRARRLRLTVVDSRNEPLRLESAQYAAPARLLVFKRPAQVEPLALFVGNSEASAPNYDFTATVPSLVEGVQVVRPGSRQDNPSYVPPPDLRPWSEKNPVVLDVVLIVSLLVLAWLLFVLARTAIRRHDAEVVGSAAVG